MQKLFEKQDSNGKILQKTGQKQLPKQQQEPVDCPDTKIWIWDNDQYEQFESDYLNQIFPYKINKSTLSKGTQFIFHFLNSSLYYWIELVQNGEPEEGKLGPNDSKFIEQVLREDQSDNWIAFRRWGQKFNKKDQFCKLEEKEKDYVEPEGKIIHEYSRNEEDFLILEYSGNNHQFNNFKKRMQVLFLFYIDGVSFVDQQINTWVYYAIFKQKKQQKRKVFVGVLSKYVFKLSSTRQRHRVSQVFILPSYQKAGHGKELLDVVYDISLKEEKCFQITTEIPSFQFQCLRDYKECEMIIKSGIFDLQKLKKVVNSKQVEENRIYLMQKQHIREIKEKLKIPGHQIQRLVNILIYYKIEKQGEDMPKAHFQQNIRKKIIDNRSPFKTRKKFPQITFYGQVPNMKQFLLQKAKEDLLRNQDEVQQIFNQTMDGFNRVITKLKKLTLLK